MRGRLAKRVAKSGAVPHAFGQQLWLEWFEILKASPPLQSPASYNLNSCGFRCGEDRTRWPISRRRGPLLRPSNPRVLPGHLHSLVVAAEANVGAIAIADLQRLVLGKAPCGGTSDTRAGLFGVEVLYAIQTGQAAPPEIEVQGYPGAGLKVVALNGLPRTLWAFVLSFTAKRVAKSTSPERYTERCCCCISP